MCTKIVCLSLFFFSFWWALSNSIYSILLTKHPCFAAWYRQSVQTCRHLWGEGFWGVVMYLVGKDDEMDEELTANRKTASSAWHPAYTASTAAAPVNQRPSKVFTWELRFSFGLTIIDWDQLWTQICFGLKMVKDWDQLQHWGLRQHLSDSEGSQ